MTPEEALAIINEKLESGYLTPGFEQALKVAVIALGKRVGREPLPKGDNDEGYAKRCPVCFELNFPDEKYCSFCGQKLLWESQKEG